MLSRDMLDLIGRSASEPADGAQADRFAIRRTGMLLKRG
jgi:hypothetical protein